MHARRLLHVVFVTTALAPSSAFAQAVTMGQLWPNDDGRSWRYDQHYVELIPASNAVDNGIRLLFDGTTTAPTTVACQYLRHEVLSGPTSVLEPVPGLTDPLLARVWLARPDLRARIEARLSEQPCPSNAPPGVHAVLLNGEFAYRKTASEVAAWRCDLADTRSWMFLDPDLTPGHTFDLQLIPDLTSDVFLHATVAGTQSTTVPGGTYANCVRIDYVVDYGTSQCTDEFGNPTGTAHAVTAGYVLYAPNEGPVESFEEFIPGQQITGTCSGFATGEAASRTTLKLTSPSVATRSSTWGALKLTYR